jgi:hypothetical protein
MSTELTTQVSAADVLGLITETKSKYADDGAIAAVTSIGGYLPYIQLLGGNSKEAKKDGTLMGTFVLTKGKNMIRLGKEFTALILSWRTKAMQYKPKALSFYDRHSEAFKKIQATADEKNSNKGFGPEFLLWLPEHGEYATYFFGNKTGRVEAPNLLTCFKEGNKKCKITSHLIETESYSWHGPRYVPYDLDVKLPPDMATLREVVTKFSNPPESQEIEEAEKSDDSRS